MFRNYSQGRDELKPKVIGYSDFFILFFTFDQLHNLYAKLTKNGNLILEINNNN